MSRERKELEESMDFGDLSEILDSSRDSESTLDLSRTGYDADTSLGHIKSPLPKNAFRPPETIDDENTILKDELASEKRKNLILSGNNVKLQKEIEQLKMVIADLELTIQQLSDKASEELTTKINSGGKRVTKRKARISRRKN